MASHGVYLFRHIQTKQILVSLKPNMKVKKKKKNEKKEKQEYSNQPSH
jgi:hypothetical protein